MENIMKEVETALGLLILDLVQQSIDIHSQAVQNLGGNEPIDLSVPYWWLIQITM